MNIEKVIVNEMSFDCRTSGTKGNELVVLLHGFPESSIMWKPLMNQLAEAGYFCVAPNLRGYGLAGAAGFLNDPGADIDDGAGLFRHLDELVGS